MERRVVALERHLEFSGRLSASLQRNTASCTSPPSSHAEDAAALLRATSPLETSTWAVPLAVPQPSPLPLSDNTGISNVLLIAAPPLRSATNGGIHALEADLFQLEKGTDRMRPSADVAAGSPLRPSPVESLAAGSSAECLAQAQEALEQELPTPQEPLTRADLACSAASAPVIQAVAQRQLMPVEAPIVNSAQPESSAQAKLRDFLPSSRAAAAAEVLAQGVHAAAKKLKAMEHRSEVCDVLLREHATLQCRHLELGIAERTAIARLHALEQTNELSGPSDGLALCAM